MRGLANLIKTDGIGASQAMPDLVMAWARDAATGEPRYILELDASQRGAKCGCECPSCGKPLTAVNAAKTEFLRRPHFRHPEGAQRDECLVLAARVAALRQLQGEGWLDLPRRRRSARVAGLSGEFHEAWVEEAPVRMRISQVEYRDRATAVITLDDGRQIRVELMGTPGSSAPLDPGDLPVPTVYLAIDDPTLAALPPEELRRRARLQPSDLCWHSHWNDAALLAQAEAEARARAHFYFDDIPNWLNLPEGLPPTLRRESVLHHEVKRILESEGRLVVPEVYVELELPGVDGQTLHGRWAEEEEELRLSSVQLEARYGRLVPDITCEAFDAKDNVRYLPLLIEVTVTNHIAEERIGRIRTAGEATLEIDLSKAGGRVNREELRRLVVDEVATKRWLFHPELESQRTALQSSLTRQAADALAESEARTKWLTERRAQVLSTPLSEIVAEYLDSALCMFDAFSDPDASRANRERVVDAAGKLEIHGYLEASNANFIGGGAILARVLSIMLGRPVGYEHDNVIDVLQAIRQTRGPLLSTCSIYFIAARVFPPDLNPQQWAWLESWMDEVRKSIRAGEATYLRHPAFDPLLSLLFPEMAAGLAKPFGKLKHRTGLGRIQERETSARAVSPEHPRSRSDRAGPKLQDARPGEGWLRGRALNEWKRAHPDAARDWFGGLDEV